MRRNHFQRTMKVIMDEFDPYRKWLGIPPQEQPPNYYRLLGLSPFENDKDVIANAADRQMAHLRTFQSGKNSALSQKILNELAAARICLLNPKKRAEYDARLRAELGEQNISFVPPAAVSPPIIVAPPSNRGQTDPGAREDVFSSVEPPPIIKFPPPPVIPPAMSYPPSRTRRKRRRSGAMVTLIVSGIGLVIAAWCIHFAVQKELFAPIDKKPGAIHKSTTAKPPKKSPTTTATNLPPKNTPAKVEPPNEKKPVVEIVDEKKPAEDIASENEKIGKQMCFMKGNWSEGLPKLAASAGDELSNLAKKELAEPENAAGRLAVADGWWAFSEKYGPPADEQIRHHAVEWYQKVLDDLDGEDHDRAEWRIARETPPPPGEKPPIDPDKLE
jgi:hypothetical protein